MLRERSALGAGVPARRLLPALRRARGAERGRHRHRRTEAGLELRWGSAAAAPGAGTDRAAGRAQAAPSSACGTSAIAPSSSLPCHPEGAAPLTPARRGRSCLGGKRLQERKPRNAQPDAAARVKGGKDRRIHPMVAKVLVQRLFPGINEPNKPRGILCSEAKALVECRRLVPPAGGRLLQGLLQPSSEAAKPKLSPALWNNRIFPGMMHWKHSPHSHPPHAPRLTPNSGQGAKGPSGRGSLCLCGLRDCSHQGPPARTAWTQSRSLGIGSVLGTPGDRNHQPLGQHFIASTHSLPHLGGQLSEHKAQSDPVLLGTNTDSTDPQE
ncbi:uncharacterized protein LOC114003799 [Pipra filicauda]|uniref:Uncharacterized protein LOC114003799 n=1 Tax=Pipra filicauda TaxID=649802 RepID=A0A7R5KUP3_9PASS|nr:uncharacterized protein LOC114003799 [Pipra filicauda]